MDIQAKIAELTPFVPGSTRNGARYSRNNYAWIVRALVFLDVPRIDALQAVVDHFELTPPDKAYATLRTRTYEVMHRPWLPELKKHLDRDPSENFTV